MLTNLYDVLLVILVKTIGIWQDLKSAKSQLQCSWPDVNTSWAGFWQMKMA